MDRVDLTPLDGTDRQRRWRQGGAAEWDTSAVTFGRLAGGRWFAERTGHLSDFEDRQGGACVFGADELGHTLALRLAYSWMRDGEWRAQPAKFGADAKPCDGLPWQRRGGDWYLPGEL